MEANIYIKNVEIVPNPVRTGSYITISADVRERVCVFADMDGAVFTDADGAAIETEE